MLEAGCCFGGALHLFLLIPLVRVANRGISADYTIILYRVCDIVRCFILDESWTKLHNGDVARVCRRR